MAKTLKRLDSDLAGRAVWDRAEERINRIWSFCLRAREALEPKTPLSGLENDLLGLVNETEWLVAEVKAHRNTAELMEAEVKLAHRVVLERDKELSWYRDELGKSKAELGDIVKEAGAEIEGGVAALLSKKRKRGPRRKSHDR